MRATVRCRRCHTRVSRYAPVCVYCGAKSPGGNKGRRGLTQTLLSALPGRRRDGETMERRQRA